METSSATIPIINITREQSSPLVLPAPTVVERAVPTVKVSRLDILYARGETHTIWPLYLFMLLFIFFCMFVTLLIIFHH